MKRQKTWTDDEVATLRWFWFRPWLGSLPEVGKIVGRSVNAVIKAARRIGLPDRKGIIKDWRHPRFEDDPRAREREPPWRGDPVAARSPCGCSTALLESYADGAETRESAPRPREERLAAKRRYWHRSQERRRATMTEAAE